MTLLPSHDATDRPDLPPYGLGAYCGVPGCTELREHGGGHHVYRRSNQTQSWWVQLSDGQLIPNRAPLCWKHHREVTGNIGGHKAKITIEDGRNLIWEDDPQADGSWRICGALRFAHDPYEVLHLTQLTMDGGEVPHEKVVAPNGTVPDGPTPGQPCPTCHRRVNHPKKADSPKSKTVAYRVPLDDAETHDEIAEAAAIELGIHDKPHWRWSLNSYCYGLILQGARMTERGA